MHTGLLAGGALVLALGWSPRAALQGLIQAAAVLALVHGRLHGLLHLDRTGGGEPPGDRLGAANRITLARGLLVSAVAGFLFLPVGTAGASPPWVAWLPGLIYLAAAALDGLDGWVARRGGTESALGRVLDLELDALGLLAAPALAVWMGRLPGAYLLVGAAFYLYRGGLALRRRRGLTVVNPPSRVFARTTAGFQMGFVGLALLPLFDARVLRVAAVYAMTPLLAGFIWDWFLAVGRLRAPDARRLARGMEGAAAAGVLALRGLLLLVGPAAARHLWETGLPAASLLWGLALAMIVAGWLGRTAALAACLLLAAGASGAPAPPALWAALGAVLVIAQLGTGRASLWQPEEAIWTRRPGSPTALPPGDAPHADRGR